MNRRTWAFKLQFAALPVAVRATAASAYRAFLNNPAHPGLRSHALSPTGKGQHLPGSVSISVTRQYRAIYYVRNGVNVWYWIGSHADYDTFVGRK